MKKLLALFMFLALVGLYSCSDDDNGGEDKLTLSVNVMYRLPGDIVTTYPDAGAKVYLFFDVDSESGEYIYQLGGKYKKETSLISADQNATTATNGKVVINAEFKNRPLTVVAESTKYPGRYYEKYIENFFESEYVDVAFNPQ